MKRRHSSKGDIVFSMIAALAISGLLYTGVDKMWGRETAIDFFKGVARNPMRVGAMTPCSKFVAKEITKHIAASEKKSIRILEVGGGSGALSKQIEHVLKNLEIEYHYEIIEIDQHFCGVLEQKFANNPHITVHCTDATMWLPGYKYDFIISSLPFMMLSIDTVENILAQYQKIINPNGIISYVEHMLLPDISSRFRSKKDRNKFEAKRKLLTNFKNTFILETAKVWMNITPLYIHHLKF